ncbi:MAG: methane monooxygenase/ammonia monooxygenase subunit B [Candidatus Binatus sp.]|uniref:methane monooxygenase/ammonia monooxygenase subunit B n=1 Tax=Candidatus Binatus sp. TaxID=2811406 RepID=UPI00271CC182|nr:methane monooxygenase/ammonia monooxygenase subunit B [Candidatus Binatus sp.]MDO8433303.1 methane monooxygenase/ammonia monooxygenase subunit B [Candidatus Binatus sp.]
MRSRYLVGTIVAIAAIVSAIASTAIFGVSSAFAHGEAGDEPFLKDLTTAFYDVHISPTEIEVGQPVTIIGTVRILETWPYTLYPPEKAYITPVVPGPVFVLKERTVNGQQAPGSFFVEKGGVYNFKMEILGRNPGKWHVHPGIAVQGTGTLIGPGEWVTVKPSVAPFVFPVRLLSGQSINLNTYEGGFVWWWSFAGFLIGVAWMLYWTLNKRTVTNLAVTVQLGVNDDAPDIGLITPRDHVWMNVLAGLTIAMLLIGWSYSAMKYPVRLPQQTDWFAPKFVSSGEKMAEVAPQGATYDDGTDTLNMRVNVKNIGPSPITVKQYIMAMATFVNGTPDEQAKAGPHDYVGQLEVEPSRPIAPGEEKELTLRISNPVLSDERLIPLHDPQQFIAGLIRFENGLGKQEMVVVRSSVVPTQFKSQYLP